MDYKAAIAFNENTDFGLKLIKHIFGMANTGGGWIVIGYEDRPLRLDSNHSGKIAATYDTTRISQAVDSYTERGQSIRLSVDLPTHPETNLPHSVIQVEGFERIPFICRSNKSVSDTNEQILQEGKVYIRRPGAATSEIRTIADWDGLLKLCVSQRRDELLQEFADLFRRMTSGEASPPQDVKETLSGWVRELFDASGIHESLGNDGVYMETAQMLVQPRSSEWTHQDLRRVAVSDKWIYQDDLILPTKEGIQVSIGPPYRPQYWYLDKRGNYYYSSALVENYEHPPFTTSGGHPPRSLWVDLSIYRIALALLQSADIYRDLNVPPDEPYVLLIKHGGIKGRSSYASRSVSEYSLRPTMYIMHIVLWYD